VAWLKAVLKAAGQPPLARRTIFTRSAKRSRTSAVPSVEPSSTTMTSSGGRVWPRIASSASAIHSSAW
jgi:hypothetical protein